jgi:hypothetical protein
MLFELLVREQKAVVLVGEGLDKAEAVVEVESVRAVGGEGGEIGVGHCGEE